LGFFRNILNLARPDTLPQTRAGILTRSPNGPPAFRNQIVRAVIKGFMTLQTSDRPPLRPVGAAGLVGGGSGRQTETVEAHRD
jgi:hypothetical protein